MLLLARGSGRPAPARKSGGARKTLSQPVSSIRLTIPASLDSGKLAALQDPRALPIFLAEPLRDDLRRNLGRGPLPPPSACHHLGGARVRRAGGCDVRARPPDHGDERRAHLDRKSTRLNSSHTVISYAVFCLKKKKKQRLYKRTRSNKIFYVETTQRLSG